MINTYQTADILHFKKYIFTDTNESAQHFALVLLPSAVMNYINNLLCSVITSKQMLRFSLKLSRSKYKCFNKDSYVCFGRRDINSVDDLSNKKQPVGWLDKFDIRKAFKILKAILYGTSDTFLVATIIREWKKIR